MSHEPGCFLLSKLGTLTRQCTAGIHSRCLRLLMQLGKRGKPRRQGELMTQKKGLRSPNFVTMMFITTRAPLVYCCSLWSLFQSWCPYSWVSWLTCLWRSLCPKLWVTPALAKLASSLLSADGRQPESPAHGQVTGTYGSRSRNGGMTNPRTGLLPPRSRGQREWVMTGIAWMISGFKP